MKGKLIQKWREWTSLLSSLYMTPQEHHVKRRQQPSSPKWRLSNKSIYYCVALNAFTRGAILFYINIMPNINDSPVLCTATLTCLIVGSVLLLLRRRNEATSSSQSKKERIAKESYRVRKSNLLAVSGRGRVNHKRQHQQSRAKRIFVNDDASSISWISRLSAIKDYFVCKDITSIEKTPTTAYPSRLPPKLDMNEYYNNVKVVGLDCEMVGGGKGGVRSLLARCSVVTLDCIPVNEKGGLQPSSINQNLVVLYDKYVIPKARITDWRTQWSGITKETYEGNHGIPIVSFYQCQKEITELFSSIDGKSVVVVGHALENDFDALEIKVSCNLFTESIHCC